MRRVLLVAALLLAGCGALVGTGCGSAGGSACTRVLFIGNSYTYAHDLPGTFAELARAGGHAIETGMVAQGGATLADAASSPAALQALAGTAWSVVVLQEQSQIPADAGARAATMYPAARTLVRAIRAAGARPLFFLTWGHRDGWPEAGMPDELSMQQRLVEGYLAIARELRVSVAPVGPAWLTALAADRTLRLWEDDGSHPTAAGTYLAACVFYAAIFHESPVGLVYGAGLAASDARLLQQAASETVLSDPGTWDLG